MEKCVWVRPELVARIEFLEWTDGHHLRHANLDYVLLRARGALPKNMRGEARSKYYEQHTL
jgi:ATP-dependent DNA ligase